MVRTRPDVHSLSYRFVEEVEGKAKWNAKEDRVHRLGSVGQTLL